MQQPASAASSGDGTAVPLSEQIGILGVHHVAVIVEDLERSMAFYQGGHCVGTAGHRTQK
jgi:hypothetical protein